MQRGTKRSLGETPGSRPLRAGGSCDPGQELKREEVKGKEGEEKRERRRKREREREKGGHAEKKKRSRGGRDRKGVDSRNVVDVAEMIAP